MKKSKIFNISYWLLIFIWVCVLIIIGIGKYNKHFNPIADQAWLPYFLIDQSGNQNYLTLPKQYEDSIVFDGDDYLIINNYKLTNGQYGYVLNQPDYFIWVSSVLNEEEVKEFFKELIKIIDKQESLVIKKDEHFLFKLN